MIDLPLVLSSSYGEEEGQSWRPHGDYRRLNNVTVPDRYPLPNIADFTSQIAGSTIFSRLDLQKGYYQITMASKDVPKTAIITPFGMFEFLPMPLEPLAIPSNR